MIPGNGWVVVLLVTRNTNVVTPTYNPMPVSAKRSTLSEYGQFCGYKLLRGNDSPIVKW